MGLTIKEQMRVASVMPHPKVPSRLARTAYYELKSLAPDIRVEFLTEYAAEDFQQLFDISERIAGSRYGLWDDDPVGFTELILGEAVWSGQRRLSLPLARNGVRRVFVPAGFGLGKTRGAANLVAWAVCTRPVGDVIVPTIATRFRQVQRQLWPHIRRLHAQAGLPGQCDITQWKMPNRHGVDTDVAYGFSAPAWDESALQGIHARWLLFVVDEAGGISPILGRATRGLLSGDARMLAIGNPPTDTEASWFEQGTLDGLDESKPDTVTVRLSAWESPGVTGEFVICPACPYREPHSIGEHLVDRAWIDEAIAEHGRDAPWVKSKVDAAFSKGGAAYAIPSDYIDASVEALQLGEWWGPEHHAGQPSTDLAGTPYAVQPHLGATVSLGVDIASDGGDELVIARREGDIVRVVHTQSGAALTNQVDVSGIILPHIRAAVQLSTALGGEGPVTVKVDATGVGWGVVGTLEAWASERVFDGAAVVRVVSAESPDKPDDTSALWRPANKRAEMWLNGREMLKPQDNGLTRIRLDVDNRTLAQLRAPTYYTRSDGRMLIEKKKDVASRLAGIGGASGKSPDRADAVLLAMYEVRRPRKARLY